MPILSKSKWALISVSIAVLIFSFFVFYRDTQEFFSSLTAAILSAALVLGALIIMSWLIRVFMK